MKKDKSESNVLRLNHNEDLIKRMRNGEALWSFDSNASWYPERPMIKKDAAAVERLYGESMPGRPQRPAKKQENAAVRSADEVGSDSNVVTLLPQVDATGRAS